MLPVFVSLAIAEPSVPVTAWEARVAAVAGAQIVELPAFAAELSHGIGGAGTLGVASWSARWLGAERSVEGSDAVTIQFVDVGVSTSLPFSPGLFVSSQLGTPAGWTTNTLATRFAEVQGKFSGEGRVGVALHTESEGYALAPHASFVSEFRATPRLSLGLSGDAQAWFVDAAPPLTASAAAYTRWGPAPQANLGIATGIIVGAANENANPDWVGLASAGSTDGWLRIRPAWSPARSVWVVADLGGRLRIAPYVVAESWAMAGVEVQVSGLHTGKSSSEPVRWPFSVEAPHAERVSVAGSFLDWVPVEMSRDDAGIWRVSLEILPGTYEYVYLLDGVATAPPETATHMDDGMGGSNGLLVVSAN